MSVRRKEANVAGGLCGAVETHMGVGAFERRVQRKVRWAACRCTRNVGQTEG